LANGVERRQNRARGDGDRAYALISDACEAVALQALRAGATVPGPASFQRLGVLSASLLWIVDRDSFLAASVGPDPLRNAMFDARQRRKEQQRSAPRRLGPPPPLGAHAQAIGLLGMLQQVAAALIPESPEAAALAPLADPAARDRAVAALDLLASNGTLRDAGQELDALMQPLIEVVASLEEVESIGDIAVLATAAGAVARVAGVVCSVLAELGQPGVTPAKAETLVRDAVSEARRIVAG
jgi:hypothetical protein